MQATVEDLAWVWVKEQSAVLQDGLRLLLLSWDRIVPALWDFLRENSQSLNHLALIAIGAIGIPLLWIRTRAADRQARAANEQSRIANVQAKTAEQGHITDRFTKAIEQLGSEKMAVRLGAIYALERLSKDSREDHWAIMEVLTAYVRDNAPWPPKEATGNPFVELQAGSKKKGAAWIRPASDIQTILTVLGRRDEEAREADVVANRRLDLSGTDLRGIDLRGANLQWALFDGAHLTDGTLAEADLKGAVLAVAHLTGTQLSADLQHADLHGADLQGAKYWHVSKEGDFVEANLTGADLAGADLRRANGLTQEQLNSALGDDDTILPDDLSPRGVPFTRPAHWPTRERRSPTTSAPSPPPPPEAPAGSPNHTSR
jgi:hypothetical protein